jgi:hypothetical protein
MEKEDYLDFQVLIKPDFKEKEILKVLKLKRAIHFIGKDYFLYGKYVLVRILGNMKYLVMMECEDVCTPVIHESREFLEGLLHKDQKIFEGLPFKLFPQEKLENFSLS